MAGRRDDILCRPGSSARPPTGKPATKNCSGVTPPLPPSPGSPSAPIGEPIEASSVDYLRASRGALQPRRTRFASALATVTALALAASAIAVIAGSSAPTRSASHASPQSEEIGAEALDLFPPTLHWPCSSVSRPSSAIRPARPRGHGRDRGEPWKARWSRPGAPCDRVQPRRRHARGRTSTTAPTAPSAYGTPAPAAGR